jgi:photosystem II stability/assembly factor-like uncharacterized protein
MIESRRPHAPIRWRWAFVVGPIAAVSLASSSPASANGRFPRAERLLEDPSDPQSLMLGATYGLLTTSDRGQNWYYLCEQAFSLQEGYVGDPLIDRTGDGTLVVGVQASLNISRDHGCNWTSSFGGSGEGVADYTIVRATPNTLLALHLKIEDGAVHNDVVESTDAGTSFHSIGVELPLLSVNTIDVPPSDPTRIYVTGLDAAGQGQFVVSHDHAAHWTSHPIPNTNADEVPYIAAVDPAQPARVFVRTDAWTNRDIIDTANDALLTTDDEGTTWTERFRTGAKLFGFALSDDSSTVLIGYGDPIESAQLIDTSVTGLYRASTTDYQFDEVMSGSVTCLTWNHTGLYVCTQQADVGYELSFSKTVDGFAQGGDAVRLLRRNEVKGPPPCCGSGGASLCAASWPTTCSAVFDACPNGVPDASVPDPAMCTAYDGGTTNTGDGAAASTGAASSNTGGGTSMTSSGSIDSSTTGNAQGSNSSSGCNLAASGRRASSPEGSFAALALLAGASTIRARRTRRRRFR